MSVQDLRAIRKKIKREKKSKAWAKHHGVVWTPNLPWPAPEERRKKSKKPQWQHPYDTEEGRVERDLPVDHGDGW